MFSSSRRVIVLLLIIVTVPFHDASPRKVSGLAVAGAAGAAAGVYSFVRSFKEIKRLKKRMENRFDPSVVGDYDGSHKEFQGLIKQLGKEEIKALLSGVGALVGGAVLVYSLASPSEEKRSVNALPAHATPLDGQGSQPLVITRGGGNFGVNFFASSLASSGAQGRSVSALQAHKNEQFEAEVSQIDTHFWDNKPLVIALLAGNEEGIERVLRADESSEDYNVLVDEHGRTLLVALSEIGLRKAEISPSDEEAGPLRAQLLLKVCKTYPRLVEATVQYLQEKREKESGQCCGHAEKRLFGGVRAFGASLESSAVVATIEAALDEAIEKSLRDEIQQVSLNLPVDGDEARDREFETKQAMILERILRKGDFRDRRIALKLISPLLFTKLPYDADFPGNLLSQFYSTEAVCSIDALRLQNFVSRIERMEVRPALLCYPLLRALTERDEAGVEHLLRSDLQGIINYNTWRASDGKSALYAVLRATCQNGGDATSPRRQALERCLTRVADIYPEFLNVRGDNLGTRDFLFQKMLWNSVTPQSDFYWKVLHSFYGRTSP